MSNLVYKRKGSSCFYVVGSRVSTRTSDKEMATAFARKHLQEALRQEALGSTKTWGDLTTAWTSAKSHKKSISRDLAVIADASIVWASSGKPARELLVADITADMVRAYGKAVKDRASASTANRHLNVIRAMLNFAEASEWITRAPTVELYPVTVCEARWITPEDFQLVLPHLPKFAADLLTVSVQTGMRFSNVLGLKWSWITEGVVVVPSANTKTGRRYIVPLSKVAREVIQKLAELSPKGNSEYVFEQRTYFQYRAEWARAVKAAGLPHTRIHDLRHSWASAQVKAGTPDRIVATLGGWSSPAQISRYAHLSVEHLSTFADAF